MTRTLTPSSILAIILAAIFTATISVLMVAGSGRATNEHCPGGGTKVESEVDGDLNDIVLPAGTIVCVKGGTEATGKVEADGETSLVDILDNGKDVSYYIVYEPEQTPPPTAPPTAPPTEQPTVPPTAPPTEPPDAGGGTEGYICGDPRVVIFLPDGLFDIFYKAGWLPRSAPKRVNTVDGPRTFKTWVRGRTTVTVRDAETGKYIWSIRVNKGTNIGSCDRLLPA